MRRGGVPAADCGHGPMGGTRVQIAARLWRKLELPGQSINAPGTHDDSKSHKQFVRVGDSIIITIKEL